MKAREYWIAPEIESSVYQDLKQNKSHPPVSDEKSCPACNEEFDCNVCGYEAKEEEIKALRTTNAKLVERHNEDLEIIAKQAKRIEEMERDKNNRYGAPSGGEKMIEVVIKNEEKSS